MYGQSGMYIPANQITLYEKSVRIIVLKSVGRFLCLGRVFAHISISFSDMSPD